MAKSIEPAKQVLLQQVLEYWYTIDFLNQGALQTEQTRRDKENYAFAMKHPKQFGALYRHDFLHPSESVLEKIKELEQAIEARKKQDEQQYDRGRSQATCCHGKATIYLGRINRAFLTGKLAEMLKCAPPDNPSADQLAWASFQVTDDGKYVRGSFSLSPIIWAVSRVKEMQEGMSMYEVLDPDAYKKNHEDFEPSDKEPCISYDALHSLAEIIYQDTILPINGDAPEAEAVSDIHYTFSIYRNADERDKRETDDYYGLSMSFYASDIAGFKKTVVEGKWVEHPMWNALIDYISAPYDMAKRLEKARKDLSIDALRNPETAEQTKAYLRDVLSVEKTPWGKWPSKYQPFLMQQVAINLAINTNEPIFAVNGPPGTGKTSLLKEIIAENVVQRALVLSEYDMPDKVFVSNEFRVGASRYYYYSLRPDMKDIRRYGIVVASSNNNAVENISKQLPLVENLEKNLADTGSEMIESVRKMFSLEHAKRETIKRKNYEKENQPVEIRQIPDVYFSSYAGELLREPCWGLISAPLGKRSNIVSFHKRVLKQLFWDFYRESSFCRNRLSAYEDARKRFITQYHIVKDIREKLQREVTMAERTGLKEAGTGSDTFICMSDELLERMAAYDNDSRKAAQMSNPRTTERYDREREKLFRAALELTKEFVLASECCKSNFDMLGMAWGVESYNNFLAKLEDTEREDILRKSMTALLQTLQILVPVISTTFASAGRFFKYVNKLDALGTVIVDEAGQATPQMALRLFSRASRAIIVGDPNQIDPVVTDELAFLEATLDQDIGEVYSDRTISVQKIADYLSEYGGIQSDALGVHGKKWVGIPLYVHSRCIEPMFSISNRLSYGDVMLRITSEPKALLRSSFCYPTSQWINVGGEEEKKKNHFIRKQGEKVLELLNEAFARNAEKENDIEREAGPDLFIISPFSTVAEGMKQLLATSMTGEYPALAANREIVENWLIDEQNPHIGTVHTFQGREANEVIFLLGCDMESRKSANWVNRNIVNVAVSRAKYRLYVIGETPVWEQCDPIMEMKYDLDSYAFERLARIANNTDDDDLFDIPDLPSSEMFEIDEIEDAEGTEYAIDASNSISNVQMYVPAFGDDFTEEQLGVFGMHSMEEFTTRFSLEVQGLLRTGMWNYIWLKPLAHRLPEFFDASSVAVCFCKAFELSMKEHFFRGLQMFLPDAQIRGKQLRQVESDTFMIGEYSTVISQSVDQLAKRMARINAAEFDADWWAGFLDKLRACRVCRNDCCHHGKRYSWEELEQLLELLFRDSIAPKRAFWKKERIIPGLMCATGFRQAIEKAMPGEWEKGGMVDPAVLEDPIEYADFPAQIDGYVTHYCPVTTKIRTCPVDMTLLENKPVSVRKRIGVDKKLNMQFCKQCGRYYINTMSLSDTIKLDEFVLTPVK